MSTMDVSTNLLWQTLSRAQGRTRDEQHPLLEQPEDRQPTSTRGCGWLSTAFLLVNTALGIGILNFPAAYDQAGGIFYATLLQVVMVTLMITTMLILAFCSDVNGDLTYHDVLLSMCGRRGQQLAAVSITLTLYCVCVAFLIIIGDQMDNLLLSVLGRDVFCKAWYLQRSFSISCIALLFILPTCFCKRVDFLACFGSVGIFAMLYPVFLTVYGYFKLDVKDVIIKTKPDSLSAMFAMMPVLGLGYQCQEVVVPVYSCMRQRNLLNFIKSSLAAMLFLFVIYSITGCFGYLTFGQKVAHNVMKMYDAQDPFVVVGVAALVLKMVATYPTLAICGRDAVTGLYAEVRGVKRTDASEKRHRYVAGGIWFISSLCLATMTSGIGVVIKYLGSVASANIFIYPGICLIQVVRQEDPEIRRWRSRCFAAYGVLVAGVGAFCLGVVLLEAILRQDDTTNTGICHPL